MGALILEGWGRASFHPSILQSVNDLLKHEIFFSFDGFVENLLRSIG